MNGYLMWSREKDSNEYKTGAEWIRAGMQRFEEKSGGEQPNHIVSRDGAGLTGIKTSILDIVPEGVIYIGIDDGRLYEKGTLTRLEPS